MHTDKQHHITHTFCVLGLCQLYAAFDLGDLHTSERLEIGKYRITGLPLTSIEKL